MKVYLVVVNDVDIMENYIEKTVAIYNDKEEAKKYLKKLEEKYCCDEYFPLISLEEFVLNEEPTKEVLDMKLKMSEHCH